MRSIRMAPKAPGWTNINQRGAPQNGGARPEEEQVKGACKMGRYNERVKPEQFLIEHTVRPVVGLCFERRLLNKSRERNHDDHSGLGSTRSATTSTWIVLRNLAAHPTPTRHYTSLHGLSKRLRDLLGKTRRYGWLGVAPMELHGHQVEAS